MRQTAAPNAKAANRIQASAFRARPYGGATGCAV
jgi:hypothetical protein